MSSPQTPPPVHDTPPDGAASPFLAVPVPQEPPRRLRRWLLAGAAAVVLVLAGAGYATADRFAAIGAYRFVTPAQFNGIPVDTDSPLMQRVRSDASSGTSDRTSFAATYGTPSSGYVMVIGYEHHDFVPSWSVDRAIARAAATQHVPEMHSVEPGPRGGAMKCGIQRSDDLVGPTGALCVWADGSMQAMFSEFGTGRSLDPARVEEDARAFRLLAEQPA
ncbi:hypothetical protein [Streptomyces sp. NRRL B-24484]|uniref:hypothetical protein n=1 Tax=Streptomyces sp. NRRL B-24484 TaxID=1463833 RepID=UPI0004C1FF7F|nr:hypothetical protein [Streptomyces sp. NRRL B-24484]